jgi:glyoxylase-like metal-dependent hydrolase (beta-lactamase superfamily II)
MTIYCFPLGILQTNAYLVVDEAGKQAMAIDPGGDPAPILALLHDQRLTLRAIIATHGHQDHLSGLEALQAATGAPLLAHRGDLSWMTDPPDLGLGPLAPVTVDHFIAEGDRVQLTSSGLNITHGVSGDAAEPGLELTVLDTPGHSLGSISLIAPGVVFTGDALFAGGIGRTDFPGGSFETLIASLRGKILPLDDDTVVYSGHGPQTTVGEERETNPWLTD